MSSGERLVGLLENGVEVFEHKVSRYEPRYSLLLAIYSDGARERIGNHQSSARKSSPRHKKMMRILEIEGVDTERFRSGKNCSISIEEHEIITSDGKTYSFWLPHSDYLDR